MFKHMDIIKYYTILCFIVNCKNFRTTKLLSFRIVLMILGILIPIKSFNFRLLMSIIGILLTIK